MLLFRFFMGGHILTKGAEGSREVQIGKTGRCKARLLPSASWELLAQVECSTSLAILEALHWILSSFSTPLLNCRAQNAILHSRCDCTSSKYRRERNFFQSVGHTVPNAAHDGICFPHSEKALLAYIQTVSKPRHVLSSRANEKTLPSPYGIILPQVENSALLTELCEVSVGLTFGFIKVPLCHL